MVPGPIVRVVAISSSSQKNNMKVLQINKYFYNGGGADVVFLESIAGLRAHGHEVSEFSMLSEKNLPSDYSKYFASEIPAKLMNVPGVGNKLKVLGRLFYSPEIEHKLEHLIHDTKPDIAHLHNTYHHLSASTFTALRRLRVPTVLTMHDVFPLCPNHSFMYRGSLREDLFKNKLYNCTRYRCVGGKFLPSLAATLEAYYYRARGIWKNIDRIIAPSQFMYDKLVEYGFRKDQLRIVLNPFKPVAKPLPLGDKVVYLGRIHEEKGVRFFLKAMQELSDLPAIVAGSGPDDMWVNEYIQKNNLTNIDRRGWVSGESWEAVMKEAKVIVVPSAFYENCSIAILEALSYGRIVVATDRGGNPEMIINGKTGFLAKPEDTSDLARAIRTAFETSLEEAKKIAHTAATEILPRYDYERYIDGLEGVYTELV